MENMGTWNSDICLLLLAMFFLPMFLHFIQAIIHKAQENQPKPTIEYDYSGLTYKDVIETAMAQAVAGDYRAREWLAKHVYNSKPERTTRVQYVQQRVEQPKIVQTYMTDRRIVDEAVAALVALKMKKAEAQSKVDELASVKRYKSTNDLLMEIFRKQ